MTDVDKALSCCRSNNRHGSLRQRCCAWWPHSRTFPISQEKWLCSTLSLNFMQKAGKVVYNSEGKRQYRQVPAQTKGKDWRDFVSTSSPHVSQTVMFLFSWQPFSSCPSIFTIINRWSNSGGHSWYWPGPRRERHTLAQDSTNRQRRREVEHKQREGGREREYVLHHAGKYTGPAISTHVSFHTFLSREGRLLGNCPWNLPARLIITITCRTVKASLKIKMSTHSANHHLSPAFHVLLQLCVYLQSRCIGATEERCAHLPASCARSEARGRKEGGRGRSGGATRLLPKAVTPETEPASKLWCPNGSHAMLWAA